MLKRTVSLSTYNLPKLWLDPHLYEKSFFFFMPTPFPHLKGVFSGAEGEGVLSLVRISSAFVMGGIGHEQSRGARDFLCAYHMKQVCGLGPYLHEYKYIYEHRCDKTCLQGFR